MSSARSPADTESKATDSHVVHGVWRCEDCDKGRVCTDAAELAEQHAEKTGHETSAERTVFTAFDGDIETTGEQP